ncbi:MAG: hypothetical protein ABI824_16955 [Acidobacteriota bacterium]
MRRPILNIVCSLLLMATYMWGGCVSCKQFFMLPGAKDDCCQHGKCKKSTESSNRGTSTGQAGQDCQKMPLAHGSASDSHGTIVAVALSHITIDVIALPAVLNLPNTYWQPFSNFDPVAASPPDFPVLNSSLRI